MNTEDSAKGRVGKVLPFLAPGRYRVPFILVELNGSQIFVPKYAKHRPAAGTVLSGKTWEPETHALVEGLLARRPGDIVHAGAFFGDMLPGFSRSARTVYAFEPVLENYVLARLCVTENEIENVQLFHAALSDHAGTGRIATVGKDGRHKGGNSSLKTHGQIVTLMTIDGLGLMDVSIIQLDVEGHELAALQGAVETIKRCAPFVLIEDNREDAAPWLTEQGYRCAGKTKHLSLWAMSAFASDADEVIATLSTPATA